MAQSTGALLMIELIHLYRDLMRAIEQQTGMSQTRFELMHELMHAEEISQAELAQHLGVEPAVVTRIVKQLEAAGQVVRRPDPADNRFMLVSLSASGRVLINQPAQIAFKQHFGDRLTQGLSPVEVEDLLRMLRQVSSNLNPAQDAPPAIKTGIEQEMQHLKAAPIGKAEVGAFKQKVKTLKQQARKPR